MVKEKDLKILKRFKEKLSSSIPIKKIILFGSRAKGKTSKWSDFDILIVSDKFKGKRSFERGIGFYNYWDTQYPVDFLLYTSEEFNRLKKKVTIVREAVNEGIEI